jgi:hypothetical protein
MDLLKQPPRSTRETLAGAAGLARTTDKARAFLNGTLGEFHYGYDCPHDWAVFDALGIDGAKFTVMVERLDTDDAIAHWVKKTFLARLPDGVVDSWNADWLALRKGGALKHVTRDHPLHYLEPQTFEAFRARIAPDRPDIVRFVDLLDYEDGRPVPIVE